MRLGERLVREGLITAEQLDAGLRTQAQYGGRIGSNLVELGFLEVDALALALSRHLGVPAALGKHFAAVDPGSARLISSRVAERRRAIPLGWSTRQAKTLIVAFADPLDLAAVDEIAVLARARVQTSVAPEARIRAALERLYGVRPEGEGRRFVRVDPVAAQPIESEPPVPAVLSPPVSRPEPAPVARSTARLALSMPPPSLREPAEPPAIDAPVLASPEPPPISQPRPRSRPPSDAPRHPSLRPVLTVDEALAALADAPDRDAVGDTVTDFLSMHFRVALVTLVKDGAALGWKGFAPFVDPDVIEAVAVPLSAPSILRSAFEARRLVTGAPCEGAALARLFKLLRCEAPHVSVAAPVVVQGRVVNLVYGHGEPFADLDLDAVDEVARVVAGASDAYVRILRARAAAS